MKTEYIIKCDSKTELNCIENGLSQYKKYLFDEIEKENDSLDPRNYILDNLNEKLKIVENMIEKL
jgi:hypothetical protein